MASWSVFLNQRAPRPAWNHRLVVPPARGASRTISHCATIAQAVRTAQRAYPGWTVVAAERQS